MYFNKKWIIVLIIFTAIFSACGGGGSNKNTDPEPEPEAFHKLCLDGGLLTVELATKGDRIINLVKDGVATLPISKAKKIHWNGQCGWPYKSADYISSSTIITELYPEGDKGLVTVESSEGIIYSLNIDFIDLTGSKVKITVDKKDNLLVYGDANPKCSWDDDSGIEPEPEPENFHKICLDGGLLTVELATKGDRIINLVKDGVATLPISKAKKIHWNGQCGWPYKSADYISSLTIITGLYPEGDKGLITVESNEGIIYSLNIDFIDLTGSKVKIAVDKKDDLLVYGDANPKCWWELE
jgi:hypothetical protein